MSAKSNPEQALVSSLRNWSMEVKAKKGAYSHKAIESLQTVKMGCSIYIATGKLLAETASSGYRIVNEVMTSDKLRPAAETFIGNCINDFASRVNEVANLVENASKNREIQKAIRAVAESYGNFEKVIDSEIGKQTSGNNC